MKIPPARIIETQTIGSTLHHKLVWDSNDPTLDLWIPEQLLEIQIVEGETDSECQTQKDKDKGSCKNYVMQF